MVSSIRAQENNAAEACAALTALSLPDTGIVAADIVDETSFAPPTGRPLQDLPAFCRVIAQTEPAVRFELWLPAGSWNGKFMGVGNGANAGRISYGAMGLALRRGYAVASTDTGHATDNARDARWAAGHPELMIDFGHRSMHVMTENAKSIVLEYYGNAADRSYYVGCSTGGRQGLMEAQRYPDDYDGLLVGAPASNWTRFQTGGHLWVALAMGTPESHVPASRLPLIEQAVTTACDSLDGVADGVLEDPRRCSFDARELLCKPGQDAGPCLSPGQAAAVNKIWSGSSFRNGEAIYPGYTRGAEAQPGGWERYMSGSGPMTGTHWVQSENTLKYMIVEDADWTVDEFDFDRDVPLADAKLGDVMNAHDPDLSGLRQGGGRLLMYHGWNDPSISPLNTVNYYENAVATWREQTGVAPDTRPEFIRLFMVPGMLHCAGGPGTDTFDGLAALEHWVEQGEAPETIPASHEVDGEVLRTRPLCAYPRVAVYSGTGSIDAAENFACQDPRR